MKSLTKERLSLLSNW